jgi:drug/metabolite transporter (DMT)-like permease
VENLGGARLTLAGLVVGVASALTHGTFSLVGKKLTGDYDSLTILAYAFGFAALTLLPFHLAAGSQVRLTPALAFHFTALVLGASFVGFLLYISALQFVQASVASVIATIEVLFAPTLSYFFLAQQMDPLQIAGAALVVCGVVLVSWKARAPRAI